MRRRTLGRGLSELISGEALAQTRAVVEVPVGRIAPNPFQPRISVESDSLEELTLSIEAHGVIQPIITRLVGDDYEIIAGERRWRAAQRAGLETVPCIVQDVSNEEALQLALIENLQREDLSSIEAARGYRRLMDEFGMTQEQLSQLIGKSRSGIANTLRLLDLPQEIQEGIQSRLASEGHGRALLGLAGDADGLLAAWRKVLDDSLTVRETEKLVRETAGPRPMPPPLQPGSRRLEPNLRAAQERIQDALATRVRIRPNGTGGGKIEIRFSSGEEFERLLDALGSLGQAR